MDNEYGLTYSPPVIPTPPLTINDPVEVELDSLPPLIITSEPMFNDPPMPTPPVTINAPADVEVEAIDEPILVVPSKLTLNLDIPPE